MRVRLQAVVDVVKVRVGVRKSIGSIPTGLLLVAFLNLGKSARFQDLLEGDSSLRASGLLNSYLSPRQHGVLLKR